MTVSAGEQKMVVSAKELKTMKRVVVDHFCGPEALNFDHQITEADIDREVERLKSG